MQVGANAEQLRERGRGQLVEMIRSAMFSAIAENDHEVARELGAAIQLVLEDQQQLANSTPEPWRHHDHQYRQRNRTHRG